MFEVLDMEAQMGVNLRASAYLHQGNRKHMEDEFQVAYQKTADNKNIEHAFFGIFDGHGGKHAAQFAKNNLMDNIISQRAFWSDDDEDVLNAIREGFLQTHHAMWKVLDEWPRTGSGWPSTSGTTASIAFIRKQKLYIGHVGDSGIVLGHEFGNGDWVGQRLTDDHKPESVPEMTRIMDSGGKVVDKSGVPRVVWNRPKSGHKGPVRRSTPMDEIPFLAVARSLGDLWSYNPKNDEFIVSPEPDVCVIEIDVTRHRCLIFGTDGLWNALTSQNAVDIANYVERNNEKHHLGIKHPCGKKRLWINPSKSIVYGALQAYKRMFLRADNTSAVTVFLDPVGKAKKEILLQQAAARNQSNLPIYNSGSPPPVRMNVYSDPYEAVNTSINPDFDSANVPSTSTAEQPVVVESVYDENEEANVNSSSRSSDIQIPVISSSSESTETKRTTRSTESGKNENRTHSRRWRPSTSSVFPPKCGRVLKSMNRESHYEKPLSCKRKHVSLSEKDTKSARMTTRAHTLSAKSMVTRSQEKMLKK